MTNPASKHPINPPANHSTKLAEATLLQSNNKAFADNTLIDEQTNSASQNETDPTIDHLHHHDFDINNAQHHVAAASLDRRTRYSKRAKLSQNPQVSLIARGFYILITATIYGMVGMIIDLLVALGRSLVIIEANDKVFWLFAPFAFVIGTMISTFTMCLTNTDNNVSYRSGRIRLPSLNPKALQQDINRGLIKAAVLSVIIGLAYTVIL